MTSHSSSTSHPVDVAGKEDARAKLPAPEDSVTFVRLPEDLRALRLSTLQSLESGRGGRGRGGGRRGRERRGEDEDEEGKYVTINDTALKRLTEMGFSSSKALHALVACGQDFERTLQQLLAKSGGFDKDSPPQAHVNDGKPVAPGVASAPAVTATAAITTKATQSIGGTVSSRSQTFTSRREAEQHGSIPPAGAAASIKALPHSTPIFSATASVAEVPALQTHVKSAGMGRGMSRPKQRPHEQGPGSVDPLGDGGQNQPGGASYSKGAVTCNPQPSRPSEPPMHAHDKAAPKTIIRDFRSSRHHAGGRGAGGSTACDTAAAGTTSQKQEIRPRPVLSHPDVDMGSDEKQIRGQQTKTTASRRRNDMPLYAPPKERADPPPVAPSPPSSSSSLVAPVWKVNDKCTARHPRTGVLGVVQLLQAVGTDHFIVRFLGAGDIHELPAALLLRADEGAEEIRAGDGFAEGIVANSSSTAVPSGLASHSTSVPRPLQVGHTCLARYSGDGHFYPASIIEIQREKEICDVLFVGYEDEGVFRLPTSSVQPASE